MQRLAAHTCYQRASPPRPRICRATALKLVNRRSGISDKSFKPVPLQNARSVMAAAKSKGEGGDKDGEEDQRENDDVEEVESDVLNEGMAAAGGKRNAEEEDDFELAADEDGSNAQEEEEILVEEDDFNIDDIIEASEAGEKAPTLYSCLMPFFSSHNSCASPTQVRS
jgi:hypothetical protein